MADVNETKNLAGKTVSGAFWKFGERIIAQLVSMLVSIILARILLPEDYGIVALVLVFISLCNVFVTNGLGRALVHKKDTDHLDFSSIFYVNVGMGAILYLLVFFLAPLIASFYGNELITPVIRVMALKIPLSSITSIQQAHVNRNMQFQKFFWVTLIGTVISGVVGIVMAYKGYGVWALVAQYLTNSLLDTINLAIFFKWYPKWEFSGKRAKGLFSYGWKLLASALIDTGYYEVRSLIIGKKYSPEALAYYNRGTNFPQIIATNVNASIDGTLAVSLARIQDDVPRVKQATRRALKLGLYVVLPCLIGLAVVAENFVKVLLTDKWLPAVPFVQISCIAFIFYPINSANLGAMLAIGRSDLHLKLEIAKKTIGLSVILITMWFGVYWLALSEILVGVVGFVITTIPNRKLIKYGFLEQIKDMLPIIIMTAIMVVPIYFVSYLPLAPIVELIIQVVGGIGLYILISALFKDESFLYLWRWVKGFLKRDKKNTQVVSEQATIEDNVEEE